MISFQDSILITSAKTFISNEVTFRNLGGCIFWEATIQPIIEGFRRALEQIRLIFQKDFPGNCVEKGFEGVILGTWKLVGVWVKDASGFRGKKAEMSIRNTQKMVAKEKREKAMVEEHMVLKRGFESLGGI